MTRVCVLLALTMLWGCQDRTRDPGPVLTGPGEDAGWLPDGAFDEPVRALCVPGSLRCLGENSPLYDRCDEPGTGFVRDACDDGTVCREGACVPFSCVAGRPLCVGPGTSATCDSTGHAVEGVVQCEGNEACRAGACVDPCASATESRSYIGCEYIASELPNVRGGGAGERAPFGIVVANPDPLLPSRVRVTAPNSDELVELRERFVLSAGGNEAFGSDTELESVLLTPDQTTRPITQADVEVGPGETAVFLPRGSGPFHVRSTRPVAAYQFGPYCCNFTATNDASLLLPVATWGTRYRVLGYPAWQSAPQGEYLQAYVRILALDDVEVTVTAPVDLRWVEGGASGATQTIDIPAGGHATLQTVAEASQSPEAAAADMSGAMIDSTGPIAVFTGHPCTFVPQDQWACDHLEEALLPADTLGARYVLSPVRRRSDELAVKNAEIVREATYWRLVADADATITFTPPLAELETLPPSNLATTDCAALAADGSLILAEGETCEFGATEPVAVDSSAALVVAGVISGHQSTGVSAYGTQAGDPSLFLLGPVEQFRDAYVFANPPTFKRTYVTVTAAAGAPVTLDGRAIPVGQRLERREVTLGTTRWEVFTVALEPGAHAMESHSDFGIIVYAYDDYVSYAFTGGLDLRPKGSR